MGLILLMETSTEVCSVGLAKDGKIVGIKENFEGNQHASQLHVLVDELLKEAHYNLNNLDAVAISKGPGSYTGLRVGVSSAKGY
jgi:tRNA threonylcarbamoyladenosine biosynthesis protein TsaB